MPFVPKQLLENLIKKTAAIAGKWNKEFEKKSQAVKEKSSSSPDYLMAKNSEIQEIFRQYKFMENLHNNLEAINKRNEPDLDKLLSEIRQLMLTSYIEEYAVGRKDKTNALGIKTTEISPVLKDLQAAILDIPKSDNFLMKNEALSIKSGKGQDHFDARFLAMEVAAVDPELPAVVKFIFDKMLPVSVPNDLNKEIYTNYMKALVRVGLEVATPEWNRLVVENLGNSPTNPNPYLITRARINEKDYFSENNIEKRYDTNALDESLKQKIHDYVRPGEVRTTSSSPKSSVIGTEGESEDKRSASVSLPDNAPPLLSQVKSNSEPPSPGRR